MRLVGDSEDLESHGAVLPLEATFGAETAMQAGTWGRTFVLPVRRERVTVKKQPFVYQEAVVRKEAVEGIAHVVEDVSREELRVEASPSLDAETMRVDVTEGGGRRV